MSSFRAPVERAIATLKSWRILTTGRPWDNGEFDDPRDFTGLDRVDLRQMLEPRWDGQHSDHNADRNYYEQFAALARARFGRQFPGLAPPVQRPLHPAQIEQSLDFYLPASARIRTGRRYGSPGC